MLVRASSVQVWRKVPSSSRQGPKTHSSLALSHFLSSALLLVVAGLIMVTLLTTLSTSKMIVMTATKWMVLQMKRSGNVTCVFNQHKHVSLTAQRSVETSHCVEKQMSRVKDPEQTHSSAEHSVNQQQLASSGLNGAILIRCCS